PDSAPLADLISGKVRAEYRLADIDPRRNGRARGAGNYLSFKVVEDSVEFHGTVDNELDPAGGGLPLDVPATIDKVNRQLRHLLSIAFSAPPQRVSKRFSRGSMMSLAKGPGNTAVAIPLAPPGPALGSIDQVVLEAHDFGVALRAEVLLRQIRPVLEDMRAGFVEHISFRDIQYNVTLTSASAEWTGSGFVVHMSGQALTEKWEYDLTFDITQSVLVGFDAVSERLSFISGG